MNNNSEDAMSSKEKSNIEDVAIEKKLKQKQLDNARVKKYHANQSEDQKMVTNHMTNKRNKKSRKIKKYAKITGESIDVIKQKLNDKELLFDANFNVYKSGDLPPTSDLHIASLEVTRKEYGLIMKLRRHKKNL